MVDYWGFTLPDLTGLQYLLCCEVWNGTRVAACGSNSTLTVLPFKTAGAAATLSPPTEGRMNSLGPFALLSNLGTVLGTFAVVSNLGKV